MVGETTGVGRINKGMRCQEGGGNKKKAREGKVRTLAFQSIFGFPQGQ